MFSILHFRGWPVMKLKDVSIKYSIIVLLAIIITPMLIFFGWMNHTEKKSGIIRNAEISIDNFNEHIINTIRLDADGYELVSSFYEEPMKLALEDFKKEMEETELSMTR